MSSDPAIAGLVRQARRAERIAPGASCAVCGRTEHLSAGPGGSFRCYGCLPATAERELDHLAGRVNDPRTVVSLRPNAHRAVTELRSTLGKDAWPAAGGDPLLLAGHLLGGLASLLWQLAEWLVRLGMWLKATLGARWWEAAPASPLAG